MSDNREPGGGKNEAQKEGLGSKGGKPTGGKSKGSQTKR